MAITTKSNPGIMEKNIIDKNMPQEQKTLDYIVKISIRSIEDKGLIDQIAQATHDFREEYHSDHDYYPQLIYVNGAGATIDEELRKRGIEPQKIDGVRKTDEETLKIMMTSTTKVNKALVEALNEYDVPARSLLHPVFLAKHLGPEYGDYTGEVIGVNPTSPNKIRSYLSKDCIPVVTSIGYDIRQEKRYNINADNATSALVIYFTPKGVIFLTPEGGVLDEHKEVIPEIKWGQLKEFIEITTGGMRQKLKEIHESDHTALITSPQSLYGAFYSRAQGTYITKHGKLWED